ncbi:Ldh family oxidoreductase [Haladaptatus sp. GCM10025893]|uniref:Ldh family oxidoreductase n=1 Tax=Haladaptatus sp. GCM10025893 TaxID=3252659 RepID=UPI00360AF0CD
MRQIDAGELESFVRALVLAQGAPETVATEVAESLVEADLRGHGSHGSIRMGTRYREMVAEGDIDPQAAVEIERPSDTTAQVEETSSTDRSSAVARWTWVSTSPASTTSLSSAFATPHTSDASASGPNARPTRDYCSPRS